MCKKKDQIIQALRESGMEEHEAIAAEMEIGKISLVGCTSYRDETNKHLMRCINETRIKDPEDARRMAKRLADALRIERNAQRASQGVASRFYTQISRIHNA